jgi:protein-tyrosine phosphatase
MTHPFTVLNYSEIEPKILVGSLICCKEHFDTSFSHIKNLAILSLEGEKPDLLSNLIDYKKIKIEEGATPSVSELQEGIRFINKNIQERNTIYIHCLNGHGRAPTFLAAYYIWRGMEVEESVKKIKDVRPYIFLNSDQYAALYQFKKLAKTPL